MRHIYRDIRNSVANGEKLLVVLIDPEKATFENLPGFFGKLNASITTYIFVGGSTVPKESTEGLVLEIKKHTKLPIILFPGDVTQITRTADGILFLSLLSGRNPDYLIGKHVESISKLRGSKLEVIPTGYILIENGKETSVQKVTGTSPMPRNKVQNIVNTAKAGELLGMKLIYLEAGSGAIHPVPGEIISKIKRDINIPLIVGGGIRHIEQMDTAYESGADIVVIGTAFEENEAFFQELKKNQEPRVKTKE